MDDIFRLVAYEGIKVKVTGPALYVSPKGTFSEDEAGEVPVPENMPGVKGIFLGGCIERGIARISDKVFCEDAHAHTHGSRAGWICFQLPEYFRSPESHHLRMHELAHIMTGEGHTDGWRKALEALGEEVPPRYHHRRRKKKVQ